MLHSGKAYRSRPTVRIPIGARKCDVRCGVEVSPAYLRVPGRSGEYGPVSARRAKSTSFIPRHPKHAHPQHVMCSIPPVIEYTFVPYALTYEEAHARICKIAPMILVTDSRLYNDAGRTRRTTMLAKKAKFTPQF